MALNIETVPNQAGKPAILLRQAWREGKRIRKKTVANLSKFPPEIVDGFREVLKGAVAVRDVGELMQVERSLLHGHVAAVLGTARDLGLERMLHRIRSRERQLALAAVVSRVLSPDSKLATARRKAAAKRTADDLPAHSFRTLLDDLSGMVLNQMRLPGYGESLLSVVTKPTPVQKRAFQLLGVDPDRNVPIRLTG